MLRRRSIPARVALAVLILGPVAAWGWDPAHPDEPAAEAAAREALAALGPERGGLAVSADARTVERDVRDLVGLRAGVGGGGLAVAGKVEDLEKAVKDLGAEVREQEILVDLSSDVLFDFDKSEVKPEAGEQLAAVAVIIRESRRGEVRIEGHTDAKGSEEYNQALSERRAAAVKQWLVEHGVPAEAIRTQGMGETQPVAPNTHPDGSDDPEGRAKNRRVVIVIQTAGERKAEG